MTRLPRSGLIAAAGAALVLALVALLPPLLPTASLRGEIERRVTSATGRAFKINGPLAFSLFPSVGLRAEDVTLANAEGGRAPYIVRIAAMRLAVKLLPLLSGRIEVAEVMLDEPQIALEVAANGTANWTLVRTHTERSGLHVPSAATFAGMTIQGARVSYDNDRLGVHRVLEDMDARIAATRIDRLASIAGAVTHRGRRLNFSMTVGTLQTLVNGEPTLTSLALDADFLRAGFVGTMSSGGDASGHGTLRTPSLKNLTAWLGHSADGGRRLGRLERAGERRCDGPSHRVDRHQGQTGRHDDHWQTCRRHASKDSRLGRHPRHR